MPQFPSPSVPLLPAEIDRSPRQDITVIDRARAVLAAVEQKEHLFVLSHMRSYSSVLCHVLGSHPEIDGYCETHVKYRRRLDLFRLKYRVGLLTRSALGGRFVLEKMLHDYPLLPGILRRRTTRGIILLRRPEDAVQSTLEMGRRYSCTRTWHRDPERVVDYYERRLKQLVRLAQQLGGQALFIESERLVSEPASSLRAMTAFLHLREPLQPQYRHFSHTGQPGYGDPSVELAAHTIRPPRPRQSTGTLPAAFINRLNDAYQNCCYALHRDCLIMEQP